MRYRPDLDASLKGLSFRVKPRSKVGIVGRTGAGKSSLLLVLFRMIELNEPGNSGMVKIDRTDIAGLPLHKLR